mgnify:CR=1 FL=1
MLALLSTAFAVLLVTVGPWEVAPVFLAITHGADVPARRKTATLAALVGGGILLAFALAGTTILNLLGIGQIGRAHV